VSLPRFLDRVVDATAPVLSGLDREAVRTKLADASVTLVAGERAGDGSSRAGFLLAANLLARLYPQIRLRSPEELTRAAEAEIILINPGADVTASDEATTATLAYEADVNGGAAVSVSARGWNVHIDGAPDGHDEPAAAAAFAAAALGVSEIFRAVFADDLGPRGRRSQQPGGFNLVTLGEPRLGLPVPDAIDVGSFRLVGAGAIGQATAKTLAIASAKGTMVVLDHEKVALSNLQRYVLTRDTDVGAVKVDLLHERLEKSALEVVPVAVEWHVGLVDEQLPTLVALDSPEARMGVQASLPGPIYNAWTQPADVGWSRHERFGEEPCLACLYWPQHEVPSRHEQIAAAFRQHPLRVLAYLVHRLPIGLPLPAGGIPVVPGLEAPTDAEQWLATPLADDIAIAAGIDPAELAAWRERPLADVYQDGICGGALLHLNVGEAPRDILVPLAHQSTLAGVMLATQLLVAKVPELREARSTTVEARYDVLTGLPQVLARPRARTDSCICGDVVWRGVYGAKLGVEAPELGSAGAEGGRDARNREP
jgi:hypothetical protein